MTQIPTHNPDKKKATRFNQMMWNNVFIESYPDLLLDVICNLGVKKYYYN